MRTILTLLYTALLIALSGRADAGEITLKASYREAANVFVILDCVSEWWDGTYCNDEGEYRREWKKRFGVSKEDEALFTEYDRVRTRYYRGLGLPKADIGPHGDGLFSKRASISEDTLGPAFYASATLEEAYGRLGTLVSAEDLGFLKRFYAHFEPRWRELLKESGPFAAKAAELGRELQDGKYAAYFETLSRYYSVDERLDYQVLYTWAPPMERDLATPNDRYLVLQKNPLKHLAWGDEDVVFHEIVHTLSVRQPQRQKEEISAAFLKACPVDGRFPKGKKGRILEEPLAVALGQIEFTRRLAPSRLRWDSKMYGNPWISAFAKLVHPVVSEDLAAGRTLSVETGAKLGFLCNEMLGAAEVLGGTTPARK